MYMCCFVFLISLILCIVFVCSCLSFFFFKQKTAYEMRISDWSSDVCSSDLVAIVRRDHSIGAADYKRGILYDREPHFDMVAIADQPEPGEMREQTVHRKCHQCALAFFELAR